MTTKSDRNLSHAEAVAAGLLPAVNSHVSDGVTWFTAEARQTPINAHFPTVSNYKVDTASISDETAAKIREQFSMPRLIDLATGKDNKNEALRFDDGKTNWSLMPFEAIEEINKVLEFGAKKYAEWNFTNAGGMNHSRVINSLLRHIFAYMRGEDKDKESGLSHLAHAGCNIVFLLYYNKYPEMFKAKDDRHVR